MNSSDIEKALQGADRMEDSIKPGQYRTIPTSEGSWQREGDLVRIKLSAVEPGLPEGMSATDVNEWRLVHYDGESWQEIPLLLDPSDGFGRWVNRKAAGLDATLCFHAPGNGVKTETRWPGAAQEDIIIPLTMWDSRFRARCEGLFLVANPRGSEPSDSTLEFKKDERGLWVMKGDEPLACFDPRRGYQLTYAALPGNGNNLIEPGRIWRWMLTESTDELAGSSRDKITFEPIVESGFMLAAQISGENSAGWMSATLRIFIQSGALVMEFSDYRSERHRPELPPEQHPRYYAGQRPSEYPGVHYAAFCVDTSEDAKIFDHFHKYGPRRIPDGLELVFEGKPTRQGYNWMALSMSNSTVGLIAHGRSHEPDHPWRAGAVDGRTTLALEPFGSIVNGHYHACDRYMLIIADSVEKVRELFDLIDSFPILARVPLRRSIPTLDVYERVSRWINLNLDYLIREDGFRNALLTDGQYRDDAPTCMAPVGELIRLYEKTGWERFLREAESAADKVAEWIESGKFHTRGEGLDPNGGGIYQNEQVYLLLSLARVARINGSERLRRAIETAVDWMYSQRGGLNTWGWSNYLWHAGGYDAEGKVIFHWPVNTNQFATLNFRLYQLLGDKQYYDSAMRIMEDYFEHTPPDADHIVRGGGVSDTTRGVHLFTEAIEVAGDDPRIDVELWRHNIAKTLERFWVTGWILIRNSIYAEGIRPGRDAPEPFSEGFKHSHNVGSFLDILPRIQVAAEAGVSEHLTRWAARDMALEFDLRYGMEEHTHFGRITIRDTDIEPASWLDPELLPTIWETRRRGWIDDEDYSLLRYKIYRMALETFIPFDDLRGGWAAAYDANDGRLVRYLNYITDRHSHERFGPGEPLEMWGVAAREAFHDHFTHFWAPMEQFIDALAKAEKADVKDGIQRVTILEDGRSAGLHNEVPLIIRKLPGAERLKLFDATGKQSWTVGDCRTVSIGGDEFWLALSRRSK